jgi:response regulator of citrate/malate metabolism
VFERGSEYVFLVLYICLSRQLDFLKYFSERKYASLFPATRVVIASTAARPCYTVGEIRERGDFDFIHAPMTLEKLEDIKKKYILICRE